jgi:hypothetical protein
MTQTDTSVASTTDEDLDFIRTMLAGATGENVGVATVASKVSEFATLFPAEALSVTRADRREIRLFRKHLGIEQPDPPDKQRRDREVRVYEQLLSGDDAAGLPVARYYGSRHNSQTKRIELYLEYVDDWPLRYHDLAHWFTAARRLADLHAHFARSGDALRGHDFLLSLDAGYFRAWGERARGAVARQSSELGERLARLLAKDNGAWDLLADQPPTLVHNDLACKNVVADRSVTPTRIVIVDWELAGVGCGFLDLVHLKYGLDAAGDAAMVAAYRSQLESTCLLPPDDHDFDRLVAACELHKTLYRLAHSPAWNLPLDRLTQWVADADRFLADAGAA